MDLSQKLDDGRIQDKSKVRLTAMLIDRRTATIVNADQQLVAPYDPSGINSISSDSLPSEIARFTLDGRRITFPVKGVNIIVMSNGTVKKEIVK